MLMFWALSVSLLPHCPLVTGCPTPHASAPASPALESLECRNDYTTHIRCSWTEDTQMSVSLFHLDTEDHSVSPCVPVSQHPQNSVGQRRGHCQYNTTLFAIGFDDAFFFSTPHTAGLSKTINLRQQLRVQAPCDLSVITTEEGDWLLAWQHPNRSGSSSVTFQVNYRRLEQTWTELEVVQQTEIRLEASMLVPDCEYEARVRARGGSGVWSKWSPLVSWRTLKDPLHGPSNLQCVFDGEGTVSCSWELRRDLAQYITYNLSYRSYPEALPEWCCNDQSDHADSTDSVIQFSCSFTVSEPGLLQVQLSPAPVTKVIQSYKHIQLPVPMGLRVDERGSDWVLSWTPPKHYTVPVISELQYWCSDAVEHVKIVSLRGENSCSLPAVSLLPSSLCTARVRATVPQRTGKQTGYSGYPSAWSQPVSWTTHPGPWPTTSLLYIAMAATVTVIFIIACFTLPLIHRKFRVWQISTPSPFRSKVLEDVLKTCRTERLHSYTEVEAPSISKIQVMENLHPPHFLSGNQPAKLSANYVDDELYQQVIRQACSNVSVRPTMMSHLSLVGSRLTCERLPSLHTGMMGVEVLFGDASLLPLSFTSQTAFLPCLPEYLQNPAAQTEGSKNTSPHAHQADTLMDDDHISSPGSKRGSD